MRAEIKSLRPWHINFFNENAVFVFCVSAMLNRGQLVGRHPEAVFAFLSSGQESFHLLRGARSWFSVSGIHGQAGFLPRRPASGEGAGFFPSCLSEFLRHTGAGRFVRSGAIGD